MDILAFLVGMNSGVIIAGVLIATVITLRKPKTANRDAPQPRPFNAMEIGHAMAQLCSIVHATAPEWETIEITRQGDTNATLTVKSKGGGPIDTAKLH